MDTGLFDFSRFLEICQKIVVNHCLQKAGWENPRIKKGTPTELVTKPKSRAGRDIIVAQGRSLVLEFKQRDLVLDRDLNNNTTLQVFAELPVCWR